ncbi:MAG: hypothetical protein ACYTGV_18060 [Planctomycetota bacterium]
MRETEFRFEAARKRSTQETSESSDDLQSFLQEIRELNNGGSHTGLRTPVTYRDWLWPAISGTVILLGLVGVAFLVLQVLAWPTWSWYACGSTTGAALLFLGIRVDGKRLRQLST